VKKVTSKHKKTAARRKLTPGQRIIEGLSQAIAWAHGEDVACAFRLSMFLLSTSKHPAQAETEPGTIRHQVWVRSSHTP
jgi:hypothetical protein